MAAVQRRESFSTNNDPEKTPTGALHYQHALSGLPDIAEDQAAEVLREVQEPPTALEKKTVLRKLDFVMLPLVGFHFCMYISSRTHVHFCRSS